MMRAFRKKKKKPKEVQFIEEQMKFSSNPSIIPYSLRNCLAEANRVEIENERRKKVGFNGLLSPQIDFNRVDDVKVFSILYLWSSVDILQDMSEKELDYLGSQLPKDIKTAKIYKNSLNLNKLFIQARHLKTLVLYRCDYLYYLPTFYRYQYLSSFTSSFVYNNNSISRKSRVLFKCLSFLPNLTKVKRVQEQQSIYISDFDQIRMTFKFNATTLRTNWFALHSLIYKKNVSLEYRVDESEVSVKKFWLKEIKMNDCYTCFVPDEQYFNHKFFKWDEYFLIDSTRTIKKDRSKGSDSSSEYDSFLSLSCL